MADEIGQFDRKSAERIAEATRRVERQHRNSPQEIGQRHIENGFFMGKPDQDLVAGPLGLGTGTPPDNIISVWLGPAWISEDEDTGVDVEADYALQDFSADQYVTVIRYKGKWYVGCLLADSSGTGS